jgi:hypothetical protein
MELHIEHRIARPVERVEALLLAPDFVPRFVARAKSLARGELVALEARGETIVRSARFVVGGAVRVGPLGRFGSVGWRERVVWERARHGGDFTVTPDVPAPFRAFVACDGRYQLEPDGDAATWRRILGRVDVTVPLMGPAFERLILGLVVAVFDEEAAFLAEG